MIISSSLTAGTPVITSEGQQQKQKGAVPGFQLFWKSPSCAQISLARTLLYGHVTAREAGKYKILFSAALFLDQVLDCYQAEKEELVLVVNQQCLLQ